MTRTRSFLKYFQILKSPLISTLVLTPAAFSLELGGSIHYRHFLKDQSLLTLETMGTYPVKEELKFSYDFLAGADLRTKSPKEKYFFDAPEFLLKRQLKDLWWTLGFNTFTWGVTDGFNPLDRINPREYLNPLNPRKLGVFSLQLNYLFSNFLSSELEVDAVLIPKGRSPELPGAESPWLPRKVLNSYQVGETPVQLNLPSQFRYHYSRSQSLDHAAENQLALRALYRFPETEVGLYAFDTMAALPLIQVTATGTPSSVWPVLVLDVSSDVELNLQDYREQTLGTSITRNLTSSLVKFASSWTEPKGSAKQVSSWSQSNILALERNWRVSESTQLVSLVQYSHCRRGWAEGTDLSQLSQFFDSNLMTGLQWLWRDILSSQFFYSRNLKQQDGLLNASLSWRLSDPWTVETGASLIHGKDQSPLGFYRENSNFYLGTRRIF